MTTFEIIGSIVLLAASAVIIFVTLIQHTHGQGLSGAINGSAGGFNSNRTTPADEMLAKVTRVAGILLFIVTIAVCVLSSRLG